MAQAWQPSRRSPAQRRQLTLALATAEERLVEAHAIAAEHFLRAIHAEIPYPRALEIFHRLVDVPERIRQAVGVRALASLAKQPDAPATAIDPFVGLKGMIHKFAARLKGRRAESLRLRIDRESRRARALVESAYIQGATTIVEELKDQIAPVEAIQFYIEALDIGPGWGEQIFHLAVAATDGGAGPDVTPHFERSA